MNTNMKKYVIDARNPETMKTASKARIDADKILKAKGFTKLTISIKAQNKKKDFVREMKSIKQQLNELLNEVPNNSFLIIQYPWDFLSFQFAKNITKVSTIKNIKTAVLIHDLNSIRTGSKVTKVYYHYFVKEFKFLNAFDYVISHNSSMSEILMNHGVSESKIYDLKIFDYLLNISTSETENHSDNEFKQVIVAGNLSSRKAGYLYRLDAWNLNGYKLKLFGPNYLPSIHKENILYEGSVSPEELPSRITAGFGLVWDGDSILECTGAFGNYLKYNNPHKFSLYMACGIPVIVWSKSALADFVQKEGVGLVINNLNELHDYFENLSWEDYTKYRSNAKRIQKKVVRGEFLSSAIDNILDVCGEV